MACDMDDVSKLGTVWVTGGCGFIGSNLINQLMYSGAKEVVSIDNESSGKIDNLKGHLHKDNFTRAKRSVSGFDVWSNFYSNIRAGTLPRPDTIFHLAAQPRIQPSFEEPVETIRHNVIGTANMLELAKSLFDDDHDCRFIYAGSSTADWIPMANPYAWSKHAGEELCTMYSKLFDVPTSICRFYNVFGPKQIDEGEYATVIGIFLKRFRAGLPLLVTGNGQQRRDFTHVTDICNGLLAAAGELKELPGDHQTWSLGTAKNYSIWEIARFFEQHGATVEYIDERPGEALETIANTVRTKQMLEWEAEIDLFDYLKAEIDGNKD
jgi:UDP-glucose 4-epimerase